MIEFPIKRQWNMFPRVEINSLKPSDAYVRQ